MNILYGVTILKPTVIVRLVPPPPPTKLEMLRDWADSTLDAMWPPFLLALSITCFRLAFGGF